MLMHMVIEDHSLLEFMLRVKLESTSAVTDQLRQGQLVFERMAP
jgi:hypothetical protein